MTRDDIIRMAREAGAGEPESLYGRTDYVVLTRFELERFFNLAVAAEREACAQVCESFDDDAGAGEAWALRFAQVIRARGEK